MMKIVFIHVLAITLLIAPNSLMACDTKTPSSHWYSGVLAEFTKAGGCAIRGGSVGSQFLMEPYFVVNKLTTQPLGQLAKPFDLSAWDTNSAVRPILEKLFARQDVLMIIAPMTDNYGVVISESLDPDLLEKVRKQFSLLPGIEKIKILYILGNAPDEITVVHENHHVQDILAGRLPLSKNKKQQLIRDIEIAAKASIIPSTAHQELAVSWFRSLFRGLPEIAAIQAEYKFLRNDNKTQLSFAEYLKASNHDYINKSGGISWVNESWKKDATTEFLQTTATLCCSYAKDAFHDLHITEFERIFNNCQ